MSWRAPKDFLFALKTGFLFALVMVAVLAGTLFLFMHVAGNQLVLELGRLRAFDGVMTAKTIEAMLGDPRYDEEILQRHLRQEGMRRDLELTFYPLATASETASGISSNMPPAVPETELQRKPGSDHRLPISVRLFARRLSFPHHQDIEGRDCTFFGPPSFAIQIPIFQKGEQVAHLQVGGSRHARAVHTAFRAGILRIGLLALIAITALVIYLTAPMRRVSRSMDRIAAGELDHRVIVRGRDEVAAMGRSFNAMADRISAMLRGQKELVAGVSHELRSPLTRMKMGLELMRDGGDRQRHLDDLQTEIDNLDALVGELLLASRFDLGAVPLQLEDLDVGQVADRALRRLGDGGVQGIEPGDGDFTLSFDLQVSHVLADGPLLTRIFTNLLQNARRYAPLSQVEIITSQRGDRVEITVRDHGPGVDPEHLEHLFEPFYRVDRSRSRGTGAVGLGLMIVQLAVKAHGGRVEASSKPGKGLAVTFDLAPTVGHE